MVIIVETPRRGVSYKKLFLPITNRDSLTAPSDDNFLTVAPFELANNFNRQGDSNAGAAAGLAELADVLFFQFSHGMNFMCYILCIEMSPEMAIIFLMIFYKPPLMAPPSQKLFAGRLIF